MSAGFIDHIVKSVRFSDLPTFVLLVVLFQMWYRTNKSPSNLPPGPIKMPVLGHLPFLGSQPHKRLVQWKSKYGPIMQVWFGSYRAVVIQDVDLIRKSLNLKTFSGRPDLNFLLARSNGKQSAGLVVADGWHWLEQRRFSIRYLRDNGFGTNKMETFSQLEADKLLLRLKDTNQKPTQVLNMFNIAVVNPLWTIMFSEPLDQNDIEAKEASHRMNRYS
ncbi:unnamed protein product [Allacma fusca]|uniref:Cytochrome P450 n=1 Tax=Allacma fusca TaxID=39272 RepID=A0A8J2JEG1_9HEXA|nr:unnamed protein product [Allacma fusca]